MKITNTELKAEGLRIIRGKNKGSFPYCNTMIVGEREFMVIDPHSLKEEMEKIAKNTLCLFLSHYHTDHTRYHQLFSCEIYAPEKDKKAFLSLDGLAEHIGIKGSPFENLWRERLEKKGSIPKTDKFYTDGEKFSVDGIEFSAVSLPGHTAGHSGFYVKSFSLLFVTDIDFTTFGPWYGNENSSIEDYLSSLDKILQINADIYITSHERWILRREEVEREVERFRRMIEMRSEIIFDKLKTPLSLDEILKEKIIYKNSSRNMDFMIAFMERKMIEKHLSLLMKKGMVRKREDGKFERAG